MTHNEKYDPDNIFAKIVRGDMSCTKIYEDDHVLAFMDIFPQSDGHSLVILKNVKATNIFDLHPDGLAVLTAGVQKIARAINKALSPDGVRVVQYNGAEAGQTVFHIHFHIIPVYSDTPLGGHGEGGAADQSILQALASKIAAAL